MSITFTSDDIPFSDQRRASGRSIMNSVRRTSSSFRRVSVREAMMQQALLSSQEREKEDGTLPPMAPPQLSEDGDNNITPSWTASAEVIDKAYDDTTAKGRPGLLFCRCMEAIRSSHLEARQIRVALIILGLFTDPLLYRDWLTVFYAVNKELEIKLKSETFRRSLSEDSHEHDILVSLRELGKRYYFTELYELDLLHLYGISTQETTKAPALLKAQVERCLEDKPNARKFRDAIKSMTTASELAGSLFCLWGVFIVGGGATARQRAKKMCGEGALNVYRNVAGPGREERKKHFIQVWEALASKDSPQFEAIVRSADESMKLMNGTMKDLSASPSWLKWMVGGSMCVGVALLAVVAGNHFV